MVVVKDDNIIFHEAHLSHYHLFPPQLLLCFVCLWQNEVPK
eukprot:08279.XXX_528003_528125_1 [CDS] Oithona nana genome sequencing.